MNILIFLTVPIIPHGYPLLPDFSIILCGHHLLPDHSHHTKKLSWKIFQCSKPIAPASWCLHILFSSVKKFCWPQLLSGTQQMCTKPISPSLCVSTECPPSQLSPELPFSSLLTSDRPFLSTASHDPCEAQIWWYPCDTVCHFFRSP